MARSHTAGISLAIGMALAACRDQEAPNPTAPALDPVERMNVISNPSVYLDTGGFVFDEEGSDQARLLALTVWNKSAFSVDGLAGDVFGFDDDGKRLGSTRFALTGAVEAHGSRTFSITDGSIAKVELPAGTSRVTLTFTRVLVGQ